MEIYRNANHSDCLCLRFKFFDITIQVTDSEYYQRLSLPWLSESLILGSNTWNVDTKSGPRSFCDLRLPQGSVYTHSFDSDYVLILFCFLCVCVLFCKHIASLNVIKDCISHTYLCCLVCISDLCVDWFWSQMNVLLLLYKSVLLKYYACRKAFSSWTHCT